MKAIRASSIDEVWRNWEEADEGRTGGNTLGLLERIGRFNVAQRWFLVEVESGDDDRLHALHSNKRNGETNQWETLSGGTYGFPDIARTCIENPSTHEAAAKILEFAEKEVTWEHFPACVTRSISDPNAIVFCFDGCNRLAAHHVRNGKSESVTTPSLIVGEGAQVETLLPLLYGFELP